jgi:transcriptional regulator with XRE-family HTH domain
MSRRKAVIDKNSLGGRLDAIRACLGLTQNGFAKSIGISQNYLSQLIRNVSEPSDVIITAIVHRYNVDERWLRTGEGDMVAATEQRADRGDRGRRGEYAARSGDPPDLADLISALVEVMRAETPEDEGIKAALRTNLVQFRVDVRNNKKIARLERDMDAMKKILNPADPPGEAKETS